MSSHIPLENLDSVRRDNAQNCAGGSQDTNFKPTLIHDFVYSERMYAVHAKFFLINCNVKIKIVLHAEECTLRLGIFDVTLIC